MIEAHISLICGYPLLLEGMVRAITSKEEYSIASQTFLPPDALNIARSDKSDILIIDPGDFDFIFTIFPQILQLPSNPRIIVFSSCRDIENVTQALDAGATGYLTYNSTQDQLLECAQTVLEGDTFVSPCIATKLIASLRMAALRKVAVRKMRLTLREEQIVGLLRKGKTNREIAGDLHLSEKTVKHYMTVLMQKLAARNRLEVVLALKDFDVTTTAIPPRTFN